MGRKPKQNLQKEILELLKKVPFPIATSKIAETLGVSWNTAEKYCKKLKKEKKVKEIKRGKNRYWSCQ